MEYPRREYIGWKYHTQPKYDYTGPFINGRACVEKNYRTLFIGPSGRVKVSHNRKRDLDSVFQENFLLYATNSGYGFLNRQGKVVIRAKFFHAERFYSNRAIIMTEDEKFGAINRKGDIVVECKYTDLGNYSYGLAHFRSESLYGYLDRKGKPAIKAEFSETSPFHEGLAKVLKPGRKHRCFIDTEGNEVFNTIKFEFVDDFSDGLAAMKRQGLYGYIDYSGDIIIPPKYEEARPFSQGLAAVKNKEGMFGYINSHDKLIIPFELQEAGKFVRGVARVKYQHGWGLINKRGIFVVCPQFTRISRVNLDLVAYCVYGGCGYIKLF